MKPKFTDQKFERSPLSEIEKKLVRALGNVTFFPASYDKRFYRSLSVDGHYTWKQKRYLHFVFNKYRKQIRNYKDLAIELEPDRFNLNIDLFGMTITDTFKPKKLVG